MMTDLLRLKPCPFCGEPADYDTRRPYRNIVTGERGTGIAVSCTSCPVEIMLCREDVVGLELEQVVELWNTRAPNQQETR